MIETEPGDIHKRIQYLVERFSKNFDSYKISPYDEENTKIDALVYELYGLTVEEIKILEGK